MTLSLVRLLRCLFRDLLIVVRRLVICFLFDFGIYTCLDFFRTVCEDNTEVGWLLQSFFTYEIASWTSSFYFQEISSISFQVLVARARMPFLHLSS